MNTAVILLAGGSGTRLQRAENKVYLPLGDEALLAWSLRTFEASPLVERIVLVVRDGDQPRAAAVTDAVPARKLTAVAVGGGTRHASEHAGLEVLAPAIESGEIDLVAIHDAARPFVRDDLLQRVLTTAADVGGAVPALEAPGEFLLRVDGTGGPPEPVPTSRLRRVQTPQAFRAAPLLAAYRCAATADFHGVDTAESVERFADLEVHAVAGDPDNVKVTYVEDLLAARERAEHWDRRTPTPPSR